MSQIKIGWAHRCINLEENLCLFGQMYLRISQGILDANLASALVLDSGDGHVIFCSCDIEAHRGDSVEKTIAKVIAQRPEIDPDAIVLNVTHTHTAGSICATAEFSPEGVPLYDGLKYREFVTDQCAAAIVEAWDNRRAGAIAYGYGYAVVAHSRRVIYSEDMSVVHKNPVAANGHGIMYGPTKDPLFRHYEAGADHFVNLMYTFDENEKLTGVLINVPCPSQVSENYVVQSADFWHDVREAVKERFGAEVSVLPQCAAAGDLSPRTLHYGKAQARRMGLKYNMGYDTAKAKMLSQDDINKRTSERKDIADRILSAVEEVFSWAKKDLQTDPVVRCVRKRPALSRRMITDEEKLWCERTLEEMRQSLPSPDSEDYTHALSMYNSIKGRNARALERYEEQKTVKTLSYNVHMIRVGDVAFATNPFELYMDYMHRIQARSPFIQTFVVQLCSDAGGTYVATERGRDNKGYSASMFCNFVGPEGGQELVELTLEELEKLNQL